ncbi:rhamnogalacturonan lyase [Paenibacillus sambharensis]|uniref:Rhamnogalacturonan lyase n=2 Tax=Paenibacillus sambharensis TaxID=1803190 RepID=A0A2W1L3B7_9BACL|nr:rhamnogalacturonan lyase [Paenibacillus sambharensis]PZD94518.1 rhamnogalacturonan lyase [Paenibacillus sambharensis]
MLLAAAVALGTLPLSAADTASAANARQMEKLNRGLVAVKVNSGVFLSWRLLGTEAASTSFNVYRGSTKLNSSPVTGSTSFTDPQGSTSSSYTVRAVVNGQEQAASPAASVWGQHFLDIPVQKPDGGITPDGVSYSYLPNDASAGDLDGDGDYEIVLKWEPTNAKDNSKSGYTGPVYLDAYELNGSRLWRINLGRNIRAGAHYTQFLVYDFDGDGKAEVVCKTADGTVDGTGVTIGNANADYRNSGGYVLDGPEYLTVFAGTNGRALTTANYEPPRGKVSDWGDSYGNRVDRFLAGVAYLDGVRPSIVMARGYYTRTVLAAYDWRGGQLTKRWIFDSSSSGNSAYAGQGNHSLSTADVDNDGKDEIIYGSMAVDDNGKGLYSTRLGHGDAMHVSDFDTDRPGLEAFQVHESAGAQYGAEMHDAGSGRIIWGVHTGTDTGRGMAADIDPRHKGAEMWASGGVGLHTVKGVRISTTAPASYNFAIWWDGDLLRELLDHNWSGSSATGVGRIDKWDYNSQRLNTILTASGTNSINHTKGNPSLQADLLGDWREEVIWPRSDGNALRLYTTTAATSHKLHTLMHDPVYRLGIAWQNTGYNQPPHTSFYLGEGMTAPGQPNIYTP